MITPAVHDFGVVDPMDDYYELFWETGKTGQCRLEEIVQTERGPRRSELAVIPAALWRAVSDRVVRELVEGMGDAERSKKVPVLKRGTNRLSPLIGRELVILFWALTEAATDHHTEAILHGWRELAREERWWLYAKAAAPGQRQGAGWRLALFHALAEAMDSRTTDPVAPKKKSPANGPPAVMGKLAKRKSVPSLQPAGNLKKSVTSRIKKQTAPKPDQSPKPVVIPQAAQTKKTTRKAVQYS